ncbi:MAG: glycerol-3-phosphate 1-O-acyltransferase PlsY [Thermotogae bacterium]|nr:glycerol-3-phosphate 1-O-acyltransferase PlsY [Thermotogota bacterium]
MWDSIPAHIQPYVFGLMFVGGFLFGSIPWAYIVAKLVAGIDIRKYGSGNVGATNVARVLGLKWGTLVFLLDALKGFIPVFIVRLLVPYNVELALVMALAPILGHIFTPFLGFKGGKGVATAVGAFAAITPVGVLIGFVVWITTVLLTGWVSLGSLLGSLAVFLWILFFDPNRSSLLFVAVSGLVVAFIWVRHYGNIKRLLSGREPRIWDSRGKGRRDED